MKKYEIKRLLTLALSIIMLAIAFIITMYPFLMMISGSFKQDYEIISRHPTLFPQNGLDIKAYRILFDSWPFFRNIANSMLVSTASTILTCFFCALAGYTFAKHRFPGRNILFMVALSSMMLPLESRLVSTYLVVKSMGGVNTFWALIIPNCIPVFGIFLIRQFAAGGIPLETMEAARVEGASEWKIFLSIGIPMLRPAIVSLAILTFMNVWNDFLWPVIITTKPEMLTVTALMRSVSDTTLNGNYAVMLSGATLAALPILLIYTVFNKQIIGGIMEGSGKE